MTAFGVDSVTALIEWPRGSASVTNYVFKAAHAKPSSDPVAYAVAIGVQVTSRSGWEVTTAPNVVVLDIKTGRLGWMAADERVGRE